MSGTVVLCDAATNRWLHLSNPVAIVQAGALDEVIPRLEHVEAWVEQTGGYAAGFLSYEAAPAFDPVLTVRPLTGFPLLWFGLYPAPTATFESPTLDAAHPPEPARVDLRSLSWNPSISRADYHAALARIKEHIARGDTYQVNYTLRLRAPFDGEPWNLFANLLSKQPTRYAAFVDTGRYVICSASPEMFLERAGSRLTMRPMKGTAPRGRFTREDRERAVWLQHSEKNRAENVMIVDMVRNDLGRVADVGSVQVTRLYDAERYPTVWQMTSTVEATSDASLTRVLRATFPCASITGAPKVSTMRIISGLETAPRRIYTGAIGVIAPGRRARFNVAIRTVLIDRERAHAEYGVGGGIVWDSDTDDEYEECLHKARVLTDPAPDYSLIESLRWSADEGYWLLDYHLRRLSDSSDYFDFPYDEPRVRSELERMARTLPNVPHKVRLVLARDGSLASDAAPLTAQMTPLRLRLAASPVDSGNRMLFHKTTERAVYDAALEARGDADDVLLWNERGEITETCVANVVVQLEGEQLTPPLDCGLLAGTYRQYLLDRGSVRERVIHIDDLRRAQAIYRVNSVRGGQACELVPFSYPPTPVL